jgi:type I restriction-modification system DNA methylase subunit
MAIKKSDLYSSLWASCDELRGGMDASQYKDYVLFMLFIKYISRQVRRLQRLRAAGGHPAQARASRTWLP